MKYQFIKLINVFCFLLLQNTAFNQEQKIAATGMNAITNNYTSFTEKKINNITEWKKYNPSNFYSHPEFGVLVKDAPCINCVEDLSKRSENERYFINIDSPTEFFKQTALGVLNKHENGFWITVDANLTPKQNGIFESKNFAQKTGFNSILKKTYIQTEFGNIHFNQWSLNVESTNELTLLTANWSNYTVGDDGIYVTNIFPGIDGEFTFLRGSIKSNFIIKKNEFGTFENLHFIDQFTGSNNLFLQFKNSPSTLRGVGSINVLNQNNVTLEVDEAKCFPKDGPKSIGISAEYLIDNQKLSIIVPFNWINTHINQYELIIDPLVTSSATMAQALITGSMYNLSCNFTNYCTSTLNVIPPANATITNVLWSLNYTATGICWRNDGAFRFTIGNCVSPSQSGYYWFCNTSSSGNCNGSNISIFNDISSCLPAPSCNPQAIPVNLRFYRSCYGSSGCSSTCVYASSPWTMTIQGRTLEAPNANNLTVSASSICQGQNLTASITGVYGVPQYTYNWSLNSSGTPSIGSSQNLSYQFPNPGTFTLYGTLTDACGNTIGGNRTITVTPAPIGTLVSSNDTICSGQSPSIVLSTNTPGSTFNWTVNQSGVTGATQGTGSTINQTLTNNTQTPGTVTYTITPVIGQCQGTPIIKTIVVNPLPSVIATPSSETICSGQTTNILLSSNSPSTTFSWTQTSTGATGASNGSGNTINQTLASTSNANGTITYTVTPTTTYCSGNPINIPITITAPPTAIATPLTQTICSGQNTNIQLTSNINGTTFSWTQSANNVNGSSNDNGSVINQTLNSTGLTQGSVTYTVTPQNGSCIGTPIDINITVDPLPTLIVTPVNQTICSGQSTGINISSTTPNVTFSWTQTSTGASGASNGNGNTINQILNTTGNSVGNVSYIITGAVNGCSSQPVTVPITVNPIPVATVSSPTFTICSGQTTNIPITLNNPNATLSWTQTSTGVTGASNASGNTIAQALNTTGNTAGSVNYIVTPTLGACNGAPVNVTVTVNPSPVLTVTPVSQTICSGQSTGINISSTTPNVTFSWTQASTGVSGANNGSGNTINQILNTTGNAVGNVSYIITGTVNGCSSQPVTVPITVNPIPVATVSSPTFTICSGQTTNIPITLNNPNATLSWSQTSNGVTGASNASGNTIAQVLNTTGNTAGSVNYIVTPTLGACTGAPVNVTVNVNPSPVLTVTPASQTICSGQSTGINISSTTPNTTFSWTQTSNGVTGASNGSGSTINQTLSSTIINATTNYSIIGTANNCQSQPTSIIVNVVSPPSVTANPTNQQICSGQTTNIALSSTTNNTTFAWTTSSNNNITGYSNGSGSTIAQLLTNNTTITENISYSITPTANGCVGTPISVNISILPTPTITYTPQNNTICSGQAVNIQLSSSINGTTFNWTQQSTNVSGATNGNGNSINQILTSLNNQNGTVIYTVTPTANTCQGSSTDISVTIQSLPVIQISPANPSICIGNNTTLTASGATSYSWTPNMGLNNTNLAQVTANPTQTTTYTVTGTANNCTNTNTTTVTVNQLPNISISAIDDTICNGTNTTLSPSGADSYVWNSDNSLTQNGNNAIVSPNLATSYTVVGTDTNGCINSISHNIFVIIPDQLSINPANGTICIGESISFEVLNGTNISWSPASTLNTNSGNQVIATPTQTTTYTATGLNQGCTSTGNITILVSQSGNVDAGNDITICEGESVILSGNGATTYNWSNGVVNGVPFYPSTTTKYYVTGSMANVCDGIDSVTVFVFPNATVDFKVSPNNGCAPIMITTENLSSNATSYEWNISNGNTYTSFEPMFSISTPGCYDISLTAFNAGCSTTVLLPNIVCVDPIPNANFIITQNDITSDNPYITTINTSSNATSYSWSLSDGIGYSTENIQHTFPLMVSGQYTITLTAYSDLGCSHTTSTSINVDENLIYFVPNAFTPDGDEYNNVFKPIFTSGIQENSYKLTVFNRWGEIIFVSHDKDYGWDGTVGGIPGVTTDGMYNWMIEFKILNYDKPTVIHGSVTLIK